MDAYDGFAEVYDLFMDNVPYGEWAERIVKRLKEFDIEEGLVAELGCGTGKMTRLLSKAGFDMIGIDNSVEMLGKARENTPDESVLYHCQDMREFELYGTVRAIVSVCDCMNYITDEDDLLTVFKLAWNYLDFDGPFIFDMLTPHKYRDIMGDNVFAESREDAAFIWENEFDGDEELNYYGLTLFVRDGEKFDRLYEEHVQRAYEPKMVAELLEKAGLKDISVIDEATGGPVTDETERAVFTAFKRK